MEVELSRQDEHALDALIDAFRSRPVIVLTGAGMGIPLGYPSWQVLIERMLDWCELNTRVTLPDGARLTVESGRADLAETASYVQSLLPRDAYQEFLSETLRPRADIDRSQELECLVSLPARLFATTNFDSCLAEALTARLKRNVVTGREIPFDRLHQSGGPIPNVVHLHGEIRSPDTIVLTADEYENLYLGSSKFTHALQSLASVTTLFIGYSLGDSEFNACLQTTRKLLGRASSGHYAILPGASDQSEFEIGIKERRLARHGIRPIFYPVRQGDHSQRRAVLELLLDRLSIPIPRPISELHLGWKEHGETIGRLRTELRNLRERAGLGALVLRSLEPDSQRLSVAPAASETAGALDLLASAAETSSFWDLNPMEAPMPVQAPKPRLRLSVREGPEATWEPRAIGPTAIVKKEELKAPVDEVVDGALTEAVEGPQVEESHRVAEHAKALGLLDPSEHKMRALSSPLMPRPLKFGLADVLHPESPWRLDSPLIHVWIYTERTGEEEDYEDVVALTILGGGPPWIRELLETAAYTLALSSPEIHRHMLFVNGVIHLAPMDDGPTDARGSRLLRKLLDTVTGNAMGGARVADLGDPGNALDNLCSFLGTLEQQTGFVKIHRVPYAKAREYEAKLRHDLMRASKDAPIVHAPSTEGEFVTCFPVAGFPYLKVPKITLRMSGDLLRSPEFVRLMEAYYLDVIVRMRADAERRLEFWRDELIRDREKVRWFEGLSSAERAKLGDVTTGRRILPDLGIDVSVKEERVPLSDYVSSLKKHHIPRQAKEVEGYEALCEAIQRASDSPYSAVWRQCVARIFDCCIRGHALSSDHRINLLFQDWCSMVDGMLRLEWPRLLRSAGIATENVFRRNTFFDVRYDEETDILGVYPITVLDPRRAVVEIDPGRGALVVTDILDEAQNVQGSDQPEETDDGSLSRRLAELMEDRPEEDTGSSKLRDALYDNPKLAEYVCERAFARFPGERDMQDQKGEILEFARSVVAADRFFRLRGVGAHHTALETLDPIDERNPPATKSLALAYLACLRHNLDPFETFDAICQRSRRPFPEDVISPFRRALLENREFVDRFVADQTLMPVTPSFDSPTDQIRYEVERIAEAVELVRAFRSAADAMNQDGETQAQAFLKSEQAFEAAYGSVFAGTTPALSRILSYINGAPEGGGEDHEG